MNGKHILFWMLLMTSGWAGASEQVYTPINPSFGGNPSNGPNLLATANAVNTFHAPVAAALTPLQTFNNNLQSAILSKLSTQAINTVFGTSNGLVAGTYNTLGYTITVTDIGSGVLNITTTDKNSGATASFTVNQAN